MPAIQNQINLYVNHNGQLVSGSEPTNFLYRNNLNRNVYFIITPLSQASVVKLIFKNTSLNKQGFTGVALATLQKGQDITATTVSYYSLVKDWNVFKYVPSARILTKFPSTITGSIGLTVSIREVDLSDTTKYTFIQDVVENDTALFNSLQPNEFVRSIAAEIKVSLDGITEWGILNVGDKLVNLDGTLTIIRALWVQSTTEPLLFVGNPSLEDNDFEDVEVGSVSLLDSIVAQQNSQTLSLLQLQTFITTLNDKYNGLQVSVDDSNQELAIITGNVRERYPYYLNENSGTQNLNSTDNIRTGFTFFSGANKTFLGGPVSGNITAPILLQNIGNRQIYFDTTNNLTYTRLRPATIWAYASGIQIQKYNADLSPGIIRPFEENNTKVLIDEDAFELIRTLLADKISVETTGGTPSVYTTNLATFIRTIANQNETLQTKSSMAKYIDSLGILDAIKLINLSAIHGLALGQPFLDTDGFWKLHFADGETVILKDLNMWKDHDSIVWLWFNNEAEKINFEPAVLPYEFYIEDDIDKRALLSNNPDRMFLDGFMCYFNLYDDIRMTLKDLSNGNEITDIYHHPEYNFRIEIDTTQGFNGFIPFSYQDDNLMFAQPGFDEDLEFASDNRQDSFYKGRTTLAIKIFFTINGENIVIAQKVTINVTGVPECELTDDLSATDIWQTGIYTNGSQCLRVKFDGTKIYQTLIEDNSCRYRVFNKGDVMPDWKTFATLSDLANYLTAEDLPDLLTEYAKLVDVDSKDANVLSQAKAYTDTKVAEVASSGIIATTNFGFRTNADYTGQTLVVGMTTFDFATNTIYTYDGSVWGTPLVLTPIQNSQIIIGIWVGPDTDLDISRNEMRGKSINAIYDIDNGWLFFSQTTIINNYLVDSDVIGIQLISGTGASNNPFVIDKDFRDPSKKYFFYTTLTNFLNANPCYFTYNGDTFMAQTWSRIIARGNPLTTTPAWTNVSVYKYLLTSAVYKITPIFWYQVQPRIPTSTEHIYFEITEGLSLMSYQLLVGGSVGNAIEQIINGASGTALRSNGANNPPSFDFIGNMRYDADQTVTEKLDGMAMKMHTTLIPNRLGYTSNQQESALGHFNKGTSHKPQLLLAKCWSFDPYYHRQDGFINKHFTINNGKLWSYLKLVFGQLIDSDIQLSSAARLDDCLELPHLHIINEAAFRTVISQFFAVNPIAVIQVSHFWSTRRAKRLFSYNITLPYLFNGDEGPVPHITGIWAEDPDDWVGNFIAWWRIMSRSFLPKGLNPDFFKKGLLPNITIGWSADFAPDQIVWTEARKREKMIVTNDVTHPIYKNYAELLRRWLLCSSKNNIYWYWDTNTIGLGTGKYVVDLMITMVSPFSFSFRVDQDTYEMTWQENNARHQYLHWEVIRLRREGGTATTLDFSQNSSNFETVFKSFKPTKKIAVDRKRY